MAAGRGGRYSSSAGDETSVLSLVGGLTIILITICIRQPKYAQVKIPIFKEIGRHRTLCGPAAEKRPRISGHP
jgi:hypothetical protein